MRTSHVHSVHLSYRVASTGRGTGRDDAVDFGKILGLMEIGFGLGASLGSALAGVVFDYFQTYRPAFYLTIGLMLASIAGIWIAAPRAARHLVRALESSPAPRSAR